MKKIGLFIFAMLIVALMCAEAHAAVAGYDTSFEMKGHKALTGWAIIWDPQSPDPDNPDSIVVPTAFGSFVLDSVSQLDWNPATQKYDIPVGNYTPPSVYEPSTETFSEDYIATPGTANGYSPTNGELKFNISGLLLVARGPFTANLMVAAMGTYSGNTFTQVTDFIASGGSVYFDVLESNLPSWARNIDFKNVGTKITTDFNTNTADQTITLYGDYVPEPATVASILFGVVGIALKKRMGRKKV